MSAHEQSTLFADAPLAAAKAIRLPEAHVNGSVSPLANEVAGFIMDAKNTIPYRDAVRVAQTIIPLIREADRKAGVRT